MRASGGLARRARVSALLAALTALACPASSSAFDAAQESANYNKQQERAQYDFERPDRFLDTNVNGLNGFVEVAGLFLKDPSRNAITTCAPRYQACAGDTRTHDWGTRFGLQVPVMYKNRNGAKISGTVWASFPRSGQAPARMPVIVITNGSAQAPETIYWNQAQLLAARGYLVLTWDPQGQGRSDSLGGGPKLVDGVPAEQYPNFRDGLTDAITFALSKANPLAELADPARLGIAGHSYGAVASSEIAATDRRVKAVVAWDWLAPDVCDLYESGAQDFCPDAPRRPVGARVPGLNISNDYGFDGSPNVSDPAPDARGRAFDVFKAKDVDTMSVVIRGGSHYECPYIANEALGATLRGIDMCGWYTLAWFDKYLRSDPTADARLMTSRWRNDAAGGKIDAERDPNLFSFYYRSRASLRLADASRFRCDDLRKGCAGQVPAGSDCHAGEFDLARERVAGGAIRAGACACPVDAPGAAVSVRARGAGLVIDPNGLRANVQVVQHSSGRRVLGDRVVAVLRPSGRVVWTPKAGLADGRFSVRFRDRTPAAHVLRRISLSRVRGRFRAAAAFERRASCALIADLRLARPVFAGTSGRAVGIAYRLGAPAQVTVSLLRGNRVVRHLRTGAALGERTYRLRVTGGRLARGLYRVRIEARGERNSTASVALPVVRL